MLEIIHFSKVYKKGQKAVDNLSLTVDAGDIYGFIGHNGAGKSTTIKAVAGILDFEEGEILVNGCSVKRDPLSCKKEIAYIPDNPDLYEHLTGIQFLNFIGDIFRVEDRDRTERIKKYGGRLELTAALGDLISSYSHGMKQKLAICGAMVHEPKLLILDEPFVGLDPKASYTLKEIMKEHCKKGNAIFFSTHVLDVAEKLCNKVAIIKEGRLAACGAMNQVVKEKSLEELFLEVQG